MGVNQKIVLILFLSIIWLIFFIYQPKISPVGLTPETYCERVSPTSISSTTNESLNSDNSQCRKSLMIDMGKKTSLYIFYILLFFILYLSAQFLPVITQIKHIMNLLYIYGEDLRKVFLLLVLISAVLVFFNYNPKASPKFLNGHEYCSKISIEASYSGSSSLSSMIQDYEKEKVMYRQCVDKLPVILEMKYELYNLLMASILVIFGASTNSKEI